MPEGKAGLARMIGIGLALIAVAVGVGLCVYWLSAASQSADYPSAGSSDVPDRVSLIATIEKVDPEQYTATVRVLAVPRGRFTADDGESPSRDIQILSSGLSGGSMTLERGRRIAVQPMRVELSGEVTDYPLDRYTGEMYFAAVSEGKNIPVDVLIENNDDFFRFRATPDADDIEPGWHLRLSRSFGTYIMVALMFIVMWALAFAVAAAAVVIGRKRLGLVWTGMSWMAATLFALAAFRGTAPGHPPIGSILDYTAFLWAEAIVVCSLTYVVIRGVPIEWRRPD